MDTKSDLKYRLYLHREYGFNRTPFHSEFEKYMDIRRGDVAQVKKNFITIRKNFTAGKGTLSDDPVKNIRYHMIISTAITTRICVEGGMQHDEAYTLSDIYIQKADRTESFHDILNLFEEMQVDFATRMKDLQKGTAISPQVKKCIDYIYDHLHEKITVSKIASYVGLDRSYLSKRFASEVDVTIHNFILNSRIETAKNMLQHSDYSYIDIALSLGFSSQSSFTETFRKKTGNTPKQYRNQYYKKELFA